MTKIINGLWRAVKKREAAKVGEQIAQYFELIRGLAKQAFNELPTDEQRLVRNY